MSIIICASVCTTSFHCCLQSAFFVGLFLGDAAWTKVVGVGGGGQENISL